MSKNYIAKITLNGLFTTENLDFMVNSRKMTDFVRVSSSRLIVYVRVLNNAEIFFEPPEDGSTLAQKADFTTASANYYVSLLYWCPTDAYGVQNKLSADTVAVAGTTYYLYVPIKTVDNYIFGNNKMKINGMEYEVYISDTTNTSTTLIVKTPFTATAPRFKIKNINNINLTVTAPEAKTVCFVVAFYNQDGRLIRNFINTEYDLAKGGNDMTVFEMFNITSNKQIELLNRVFNSAAYAKIMIWDGFASMKPLGFACRYK